MVSENLENETKIRRFLLGEMREDERAAFEEKFIDDEDLFEQIRVAEDELIESYVRGTLLPAEKEKFEKVFLAAKNRRQRVTFTRGMLGKLSEYKETAAVKKIEAAAENPSAWNSITAFFKTKKLAFGAAFAILLLIFGFWFLVFKSPKTGTEIVRQTTPTPTVSLSPTPQTIENNSNTNLPDNPANKIPANNENSNKNQNAPDKKEISPPKTIVALALFPGTTRSEGKLGELNLPKEAKGANLQLNLESRDYKTYRFEVVSAEGNVIFRSGRLNPKNSKINAFVPAEKLPRGDYIVRLYGFNPQNEEESAADYQFRVNRK